MRILPWHIFVRILMYATLTSSKVTVEITKRVEFLDFASSILCSFNIKVFYVYFANDTALSYPGQLLQSFSHCGVSYVSMRQKFTRRPLEIIKDDGILMYLVMIQRNVAQPLELSFVQKKSAAKHLSHVVLLIEDSEDGISECWLTNTFKKFWNLWVLNIVIMYWFDDQLQIYRYDPFSVKFLVKVRPRNMLPALNELFPKTIINMHGKALRMCIYHDEIRAIFTKDGAVIGSDGLMAQFIAQRFNATPFVDRLTIERTNKSADICFHEMAADIDDIAVNIRFLSPATFGKEAEWTHVHKRDDLCVLVPKAKIATTFWNLFRSFDVFVWMAIFMSLPLAYGFCCMIYRRQYLQESILLQLYGNLLSLPMTHFQLKWALRLFFFFWIFYGMLISGAFKGTLMTNLVFRSYLPDIDSIQDLAESPYKVVMFQRHIKHLNRYLNPYNRYEAKIKAKMTVIPDMDWIRSLYANNRSYAYLSKYHVATYHANLRKHTIRGRPLFHVMSTCLVPFHAVYIVPYGSPYLGFINSLIRSSHEFGFNIYWERIMTSTGFKAGRSMIRSHKNGDDPVVLRMQHLQAAFVLLFLGLSGGSAVFLWELYRRRQEMILMRQGVQNEIAQSFYQAGSNLKRRVRKRKRRD